MRSFCLFLGLLVSFASASPLRILVDRPGRWECEWSASGHELDTATDGSIGVRIQGQSQSGVPGDLAAPRLRALLALPKNAAWHWSLVTDSGVVVAGSNWKRVQRYDSESGRFVPVAARVGEGWTENVVDGFRLLGVDFPLVEPVAGGVRIRKRLRLKLTWDGAASVPKGSPYAKVVDNPSGIRVTNSVGARTLASSAALPKLEGQMVEVVVTGKDAFSSTGDGVVRLTGKALLAAAGLTPGVAFRNIAVYSGGMDTLTSRMTDSILPPVSRAIAVERIDRNGDGILDATDEVRFWAHGPNCWTATPGKGIGWAYSINPYTTTRRYLVRLDASEPSPVLSAGAVGSAPTSFATVPQPVWVGRPSLLKEKEVGKSEVFELDLGRSWYWIARETPGTMEVPVGALSLPGKTSDSVLFEPVVVANTWFGGKVTNLDSVAFKGGGSWQERSSGVWASADLPTSGATMSMKATRAPLAIGGLQFLYSRDVTKSDSGFFPAPQTGSVDIAVPDGKGCWVIENSVATRLCTIVSGRLLDSATSANTWYAFFPKDPGSTAFDLAVVSAPTQKHAVKDFGASISPEILVISSPQFLEIAEEYALHRESDFQVRKLSTVVVRTKDVYDLWGGGQMDPVAIRDCIRWARAKWGVSHVLLLGGGHSDPRQILGKASEVQIPQWEDHSVATDDFFTYLGAGDPATQIAAHISVIPVGRIPAYSLAEARAWLDKLKGFETPATADFGPWRNTIVLAADDMKQLKDDDNIEHTEQSEEIADEMLGVRPWLRQEKLFLATYPANAIDQKPEAARDFQTLLNRGAVGVSYMGHGGASILADENLLDNAAVDRTLVNKNRPFLFFAGSCTVGRNDIPAMKGLSENLVIASGKGAAVAVSGTRTTYVDGNLDLAKQFWDRVVDTSKALTVGEILVAAKEKLSSSDLVNGTLYRNRDFYNILGDPAQIFMPGGLSVSVGGVPDTIQALSRLLVRGSAASAKQVQARLEIVPPKDTVKRDASFLQVFSPSPKSLAAMQAMVSNDTLSTTLPIPARIPFGDSAVLRVYAWDPMTRKDGGRAFSPRLLRGTSKDGVWETVGPSISVRPCDSAWSGGIAYSSTAQIHLPFCLAVDLFDSSGISSETGPDEGVVFSIPGLREPWHPDLRQDVDFRHATAQLVVDSSVMSAGQTYPFDVLARDLMGNLSRRRLQVQILSSTDYSLYEVFNSPNPVREGGNTAFYFKLASEPDTNGTVDSRVQASIRIHTVSGKLVKVLRTELSKVTQPRPRSVWDLRDSFGTPVANGIYPYTVVLRIPNETGNNTVELVRKGVVAISR